VSTKLKAVFRWSTQQLPGMMGDSSVTFSHPFQEPLYPNSWRLQWAPCHLEISQIQDKMWEKMTFYAVRYFCGLSFCMVRNVHGVTPNSRL